MYSKFIVAGLCAVSLLALPACTSDSSAVGDVEATASPTPTGTPIDHRSWAGAPVAEAIDSAVTASLIVVEISPEYDPDGLDANEWFVKSVAPANRDVYAGEEIKFYLESTLDRVMARCIYGKADDDGRTLVVDTEGEDGPVSGFQSQEDLDCVLNGLDAPTSVRTHLEQTRAIDGRQEDEWGPFSASWTYHPDAGLDVVFELES